MSGRVTITKHPDEFDLPNYGEQIATLAPEDAEILTGVYIRLTIEQKKSLRKEAAERDVSMSSIVRDALENR